MFMQGLQSYEYEFWADQVRQDTFELIEQFGIYEYSIIQKNRKLKVVEVPIFLDSNTLFQVMFIVLSELTYTHDYYRLDHSN